MRAIDNLFADYASYHQTPGNKRFHRLGIPLIVLSLLGLLASLHFGIGGVRLDWAMVLIALSGIYYLNLDWKLALSMLVVSVLFYLVGRLLPIPLLWGLFVLGWIFQFVGHAVYEKRQPAFLRNLTHLLIGPLWILNDVIHVV